MSQLKNRLINAAHNIERNMAETIELKFPNFEILWDKYLMPLTGAPIDFSLRNDTHPNLEEIAMSHFGVLKSLNYIRISKSKVGPGDPNQTFKNIYFHFGLIFDSVDNLLRNILIIQNYLKIINLEEKLRNDIKSALVFNPKILILQPKSIIQEGLKAKRVIDNRKKD